VRPSPCEQRNGRSGFTLIELWSSSCSSASCRASRRTPTA
jgi:hypothetical protein